MTDRRISSGLHEICEHWSIVDLYEANASLNELDRVAALQARERP